MRWILVKGQEGNCPPVSPSSPFALHPELLLFWLWQNMHSFNRAWAFPSLTVLCTITCLQSVFITPSRRPVPSLNVTPPGASWTWSHVTGLFHVAPCPRGAPMLHSMRRISRLSGLSTEQPTALHSASCSPTCDLLSPLGGRAWLLWTNLFRFPLARLLGVCP